MPLFAVELLVVPYEGDDAIKRLELATETLSGFLRAPERDVTVKKSLALLKTDDLKFKHVLQKHYEV